jgi:G:T/U mismatch-specific DNA glycosylase
MERIIHPIPPLYREDSRILILGSFPSVKSREGQFFYHHPQNRFWKVISAIFEEPLPVTMEDKRTMLLKNGIALWDVIQSCEITGSSDSSIRNVIANDLSVILNTAKIQRIYTNGNTAYTLYQKYIFQKTGIQSIRLLSTSPANAGSNLKQLIKEWSCLREV